MPELLHLTEGQRRQRLANLPHLRYRHRSGWGLSMLRAAGFVDPPSRGIWRITEPERALLAEYPDGFDDETGRRLLRESRVPAPAGHGVEPPGPANVDLGQFTPDERIDVAVQELDRSAVSEKYPGTGAPVGSTSTRTEQMVSGAGSMWRRKHFGRTRPPGV